MLEIQALFDDLLKGLLTWSEHLTNASPMLLYRWWNIVWKYLKLYSKYRKTATETSNPQYCHEKQLHVIIILIKCKCFTQNNKIHEINWIKTEIRNLKLSYTSKLIWQFITDTERNKVYLKENFRNRHEAKQSNFKRNIFITDTKQNKVYLKETFS